MLYDVTIILLAMAMPLFTLYAYRLGEAQAHKGDVPQIKAPTSAMVHEMSRYDKILHNIDNPNEQVEV